MTNKPCMCWLMCVCVCALPCHCYGEAHKTHVLARSLAPPSSSGCSIALYARSHAVPLSSFSGLLLVRYIRYTSNLYVFRLHIILYMKTHLLNSEQTHTHTHRVKLHSYNIETNNKTSSTTAMVILFSFHFIHKRARNEWRKNREYTNKYRFDKKKAHHTNLIMI